METEVPTTRDLLTVIVTTSVTPSIPSTELLSSILESFGRHCPGLLDCRVIVTFDGYDQITPTARLKKGRVTPDQAKAYSLYKDNVKNLILQKYHDLHLSEDEVPFVRTHAEAEYGSPMDPKNAVPYSVLQTPNKKVTFIEPSRRLGFGLSVRSALRVVDTPYVWVQQHDWALVSDFPLKPLLSVMRESESGGEGEPELPVKYVCLPAVRMLSYESSLGGATPPVLRNLTLSLGRTFSPASQPNFKIPLTPLFFWHDKPHICSTSHYLKLVFPSRLAVLRGDFIEDKIGQRARAQMKEGHWAKWATWLYYPDEGKQLCLKHLRGRTWRGAESEVEEAAKWRQYNWEMRNVLPDDSRDSTEDSSADTTTDS